jgi:hypothetical protein
MRNKEKNTKIIKCLQSAQVGGHVQIAAVEGTPAGADAVRQ